MFLVLDGQNKKVDMFKASIFLFEGKKTCLYYDAVENFDSFCIFGNDTNYMDLLSLGSFQMI